MSSTTRPTSRRRANVPPAAVAPPPIVPALPRPLAAATVFLASGAVLVLEILAVRLLAPYVGMTLETTTSIIGAALAGIALGAAGGGHLADRLEPRRLMVILLLAGGCLMLLSVPVVRALGPGAMDGGTAAALGITLLALVPGATVLSAVSPTVARLQLHDLRASGRTVGRLSAWATAGALVGTFGTGFVLVPLIPVGDAVLLVGLVVIVAGGLLGAYTRVLGRRAVAVAGTIVVGLSILTAAQQAPCDSESAYYCARVVADPLNPDGRELVLDAYHNSYVDLRNPRHLQYPYVKWIARAIDGVATPPKTIASVFVGGGGATLPRWLLATRPGSRATVLEVDRKLMDLDEARLGLKPSRALQVRIGDARMTMRKLPRGSADVVVGDAFSAFAVPWHLTTREWLQEVRRVLKPGGLYAMNIIDMPPLKLLRAELATLLPAFKDVEMVTFTLPGGAPAGGNAVLLASDRELPDAASSWDDGATTFARIDLDAYAADTTPLRDDYAPVDQLLTSPKL